jgi:hypothetical protein
MSYMHVYTYLHYTGHIEQHLQKSTVWEPLRRARNSLVPASLASNLATSCAANCAFLSPEEIELIELSHTETLRVKNGTVKVISTQTHTYIYVCINISYDIYI